MTITREKRLEIYRAITALGRVWGQSGQIDRVQFLNKIWELRLMSSSDPRYKTAAEDAKKHLIDNDDWDDDYVFLDRFKLLDCSEEEFLKFLNVVISSEVRNDEYEVEKYISIIGSLLPKEYEIIGTTNRSGQVVHIVSKKSKDYNEEEQYPIGISPNDIPFFKDKTPTRYPAFKIITDSWDDFGYKTTSKLYYCDANAKCNLIDYLKILNEKEDNTRITLPTSFNSLPATFCSLGQSENYYRTLKQLLPNKYLSVLYALKDVAWFSEILYRFENHQGFKKSLLRAVSADVLLSSAKRKIERGENGSWNFRFKTEVPYSEQQVDINFEFGNLEDVNNPNRIKALIGANGSGKTSVLKALIKSLIRNEGNFSPSPPVFSKVIAISFSIFDTFISLRGKSVLTYTYCGLHDKENTIMSREDREARLREALIWINGGIEGKGGKGEATAQLIERFCNGLEIVFPKDWVESIRKADGLCINAILEKSQTMSTGEAMILNLIASLYANIRQNSLIVFDEMEVHLHPKAIRQMMSLLFKITKEYNSACILATHSPIVVQELLADNVTIIDKLQDGTAELRILNHESLAENLSVISDEIFGEASISPNYKIFIRSMASESDNFEALIDKLSSRNLPPSLALYMQARYEFEHPKRNND